MVKAAYRSLLNRDPSPAAAAEHERVLRDGLSWADFLRGLTRLDEFDGIAPKASDDVFDEIRRLRPLLVRLESDVTIPLEACREFAEGLRLRGPVRDITVFWHLVHDRGAWQPELTKAIMTLLNPGETFLDVGANFGYFTVLAASRVGTAPTAGAGSFGVVAFEPLATHARYCRRNIELNGLTNATVLQYGLWNEPTTMQIQADGGLTDQMGGAHLVSTQGSPSNAASGPPESQSVECVALDDLVASGEVALPRCRLVKIDIEGAEPFALEGMAKTLEEKRPLILVELNKYCLANFNQSVASIWYRLRDLGYIIHALPAAHQKFALDELRSGGLSSAVGPLETSFGFETNRLESLDQTEELVDILDRVRPPSDPVDLLAVPA